MKDVDHAELAFRLRAAASTVVVLGLVALATSMLGLPLQGALLVGLAAAVLAYFVILFIADRSGRMGAGIYQPSGSSTPVVREYSLAESLVARGRFDEAAEAYQLLSEDFPDDPEPRIRLARLLRDNTARYEEAGAMFKSVLSMRGLKPETELILLRELVELYMHKLQQPPRALPYLKRIAEQFANTPTAQWARHEARDIKQQMQSEHERDVSERA
jgi:tetratricopeptide (TPR) repeat protein